MLKNKTFLIAVVMLLSAFIFVPAEAQTFTPLHQFDSLNDGAFPEGSVIKDSKGNLFGTTTDTGAVFKIDRNGNESIFALINGGELGIFPTGTLTLDSAGNLYGVAEGGPGAGVIYKLSPKGTGTVLFAFQGGLNVTAPQLPSGGILLAADGNIIGAALAGDNPACKLGCGSVFSLDKAGNMQLLHEFTGGADGSNPSGPLVQDAAGNLYGVAKSGGDHHCPAFFLFQGQGCGVVFKIDTNNVFTVLHTFTGGKDGAVPQEGLLLDNAGNLYGTTFKGGKLKNTRLNNGTIYKISPDGIYTVLHRFTTAEGQNPNGGLVSDPDGNLFGTAQLGGDQANGTAFKLSQDGTLTILHNFEGLEDGASPLAGLFRDSAGHLYGTTVHNGLIQLVQGGNVFEITP
jgi:uncharacterized repeat protein (TIGR03803 family)